MCLQDEVLVLGCKSAGKSLLVKKLKSFEKRRDGENVSETQPTIGVELDEVAFRKTRLQLRELGGTFVEVWPRYFFACAAVVFLVDMSDLSSLAAACVEFFRVLSNEELTHKPFLLLFNKKDLPMVCPTPVLQTIFRLEEVVAESTKPGRGSITVLEISAVTGDNFVKVVEWLTSLRK